MSYLFIVIIGAVTGWVAGQFFKGSDVPVAFDFVAGAVGAAAIVLLSRIAGPAAAAGFFMSALMSAIGAAAGVYALRHIMKEKPVPVTRARRRY